MTDARCLCGRRGKDHSFDEMTVCFPKAVAFTELVRHLRACEIGYLKHADAVNYQEARKLERLVDEALGIQARRLL